MSIPNSYKSEVILSPQEQSKGSSLGGLGALAGLAGVSLGGSNSMDAFSSLNTIMNNNTFNKMMINKYDLINKLSSKNIDKNLVFAMNNRTFYDFLNNKEVDNNQNIEDKIYTTIQSLKAMINLSKDKKTGAMTLTVNSKDRFLAKELLELYLKESTTQLEKLDMQDLEKKLKYYKEELSNTQDIELRTQLSQLVSSLMQKKVLSKASEYYNVRKITQAEVSYIKDKTKPKRGLIVVVSFITSLILSIFMVFFIEFLRGNKEEK
jgi:uncharacterized protein involved in exopolysaccharide biosynthesis